MSNIGCRLPNMNLNLQQHPAPVGQPVPTRRGGFTLIELLVVI
ncbi:MAG TPA: hypothetical protein DCY13_02750, partial [Verrucomicrobiales bacterium]|nr:hypothetical protein [Verrucomicrobiales bacterium]